MQVIKPTTPTSLCSRVLFPLNNNQISLICYESDSVLHSGTAIYILVETLIVQFLTEGLKMKSKCFRSSSIKCFPCVFLMKNIKTKAENNSLRSVTDYLIYSIQGALIHCL